MQKLNIKLKIFLSFLIIILIFGISTFFYFQNLNSIKNLTDKVVPFNIQALKLQEFSNSLDEFEKAVDQHFIILNYENQEKAEKEAINMLNLIEDLSEFKDNQIQEELKKLRVLTFELKAGFLRITRLDLNRIHDSNRINREIISVYDKITQIRKQKNKIINLNSELVTQNSVTQKNLINFSISQSLITFLIVLIMTVLFSFFTGKSISRPIQELNKGTEEITKGNLNVKVGTKAFDEIGQLSRSFDKMTMSLKRSREKLYDYSKNLEKKVKIRTNQLETRDKKLSESEKRYDLVVNITEQLIYDFNPNTGRIIWKGAIKEITGYDPKEFNPDIKQWEKMIHPSDRKKALAELDKAMKMFSKYNVEYRFKQKNGAYKYLSDNGFFVKNKEGKLDRMLGAMSDISLRKQHENEVLGFNRILEETNQKMIAMNEELKKLDKEKDEFISVAAHELKTPLTSIKGFAQLMSTEPVLNNKKQLKHYLDLVNKNTVRLYNLTLDIVDSSRLSLGKLQLDVREVEVNKIFEEIKESMDVIIQENNLKSDFSIEKNVSKVKADPARLLQVIRNIIVNAIHFTPENGKITFKIYKKEKFVQFEVKDTGEGIPKDKQSDIFSRFYQADQTLTRKVKGSGLGLSICKGLVETMKGKIWFESEEGKGTTFYFTIPIK